MSKVTRRTRLATQSPKVSGITMLIGKGVLVSLLVAFVCAMFLSLVSLVSESVFIESYLQYVIVGITMISIFIGSVFATQQAEHKGLLIGMAIGILYVLISVGIGMKLSHEAITLLIFGNKMMAGIFAGVLGGLIGVNLS